MSGIVAILNLDDAPVDRVKLERMLEACADRGPDAKGMWIDARVGLAHALLRTTPESWREQQPLSLDGQVWIIADARIDNREDLIARLRRDARADLREAPDTELILRAYHAWGGNCAEHLLGDFAFCIWDGNERRLFGARDPLGVKQLYFHEGPRTFLVATTISSILSALDSTPPLNEELLVAALAGDLRRRHGETAFRGIHPVPPAHQFVLGAHLLLRRYYEWGSAGCPRYRTDQEYVERFRELLIAAVACRARCQAGVALQVSGGIDSSAVACILRHHARDGSHPRSGAVLYSCVSQQFPLMDERKYLHAVAEQCAPWGIRELNADEMWPLKAVESDPQLDEPAPAGVVMNRAFLDVFGAARADGCRAVLSGIGADQMLLGDAAGQPWMLALLPWRQLRREWKYFVHKRQCSMRWLLLRGLVYPRLRHGIPNSADNLLRRIARWRRRPRKSSNWIAVERFGGTAGERQLVGQRDLPRTPREVPPIAFMLDGNWWAYMTYLDQVAGLARLELRYPFLDRRLVEFTASLPGQMFCQQGWSKWVLRESMKGVIPEMVRTRTTHGTCQELIGYSWRQKERLRIERLTETSQACRLGWVDAVGLKDAWLRYWNGDESELWYLSAWLNVEGWLQGLSGDPYVSSA